MTDQPRPAAEPFLWRWSTLYRLAARSGELVPVGRGGERRAIALANPGLPGTAHATPTLWAAIQYLGPGEEAPSPPAHPDRVPVRGRGLGRLDQRRGRPGRDAPRRPAAHPGMHFHEHHNTTDRSMAWIDGLDIPLVPSVDAGFFE
jgi:gentisate 1,2-dioxygenase